MGLAQNPVDYLETADDTKISYAILDFNVIYSTYFS
jgi:hypothetical protein